MNGPAYTSLPFSQTLGLSLKAVHASCILAKILGKKLASSIDNKLVPFARVDLCSVEDEREEYKFPNTEVSPFDLK